MSDAGPEPVGERRGGRVGWSLGLVVLGLVVPAAAMAIAYRSCEVSAARGQITVEGSPLGAWRVPILRCQLIPGSTTEVLLGKDEGTTLARVVHQGATVLELDDPSGSRTLTIDATRCPGLAIRPARPATDPAGIDLTRGSLFVDCQLPEGGRVHVDAWWSKCETPAP